MLDITKECFSLRSVAERVELLEKEQGGVAYSSKHYMLHRIAN